jgi:putative transposase
VRRGKAVRTTVPDPKAPCPLDRVNRQFRAEQPNQLWISDFTYVSTWQGWVYVAFVVDVFSRRIVGWRQSSSMHTEFVLDALEQALYDRKPGQTHKAWCIIRIGGAVPVYPLQRASGRDRHRVVSGLQGR